MTYALELFYGLFSCPFFFLPRFLLSFREIHSCDYTTAVKNVATSHSSHAVHERENIAISINVSDSTKEKLDLTCCSTNTL